MWPTGEGVFTKCMGTGNGAENRGWFWAMEVFVGMGLNLK